MNRIFEDIINERKYQENRWGTDFDNKNTLNDWVSYIGFYCARASSMNATKQEQRKALVQVAALTVASLETFDKNGQFFPRHYDLDKNETEVKE